MLPALARFPTRRTITPRLPIWRFGQTPGPDERDATDGATIHSRFLHVSALGVPRSARLHRQRPPFTCEVVPLTAHEVSPHARPTWELTTSSNSVPIQGFLYGQRVPGMKPASSVPAADPLLSNTTYRLCIEAGRAKGQVDFRISSGANE